MIIRPEKPADAEAISAVTQAAFRDMEQSDQTEHLIIDRLRAADALTISLVAEDSEGIVGHIASSHVSVEDGEGSWYGLGPLSVAPERQGQGIGSRLVKAGLDMLERMQAAGCVVAGDPEFYGRFGFVNSETLNTDGIPNEYFMFVSLHGNKPSGIVHYHPGFYGDAGT